jgi:hypothetical protein
VAITEIVFIGGNASALSEIFESPDDHYAGRNAFRATDEKN